MSREALAMSTSGDTSINSQAITFPRWPVVVFPIIMAAAAGFVVVHAINHTVIPFALRIATATGLGLISGVAVRWTLRDRPALIRWLTALAALVVGLLLLGLLTWGNAGIGSPDPSRGSPDWNGLLQIFLGSMAASLALRAWHPRVRASAGAPLWRRPLEAWEARAARFRASWEGSATRRGLLRLKIWSDQLRSRIASALTTARPLERLSQIWSPFHGRPRPAQYRQLQRIRLIGAEEHRCPFCLNLVVRNDSRGVVVCSVCRAQHHADCWAVTGMCQVPHYRT